MSRSFSRLFPRTRAVRYPGTGLRRVPRPTYRLSDGAVAHGPATARQPAFDTRIAEGGIVQVRLAEWQR